DAIVVSPAEQNLLADEPHDLGALQPLLGEQIVNARQCLHATAEGGDEVAWALGAMQGLAGNGLDGRQGVLDAMVELLDQQTLQLLRLPAFRDVAGNLRCADYVACRVA